MHEGEAVSAISTEHLPTHLDLPDSDGAIVENWQEHPQGILLTDTILPVVERLYPGANCGIGQGAGIYWKITDPPLRGALAPDWFLVPGVNRLMVGGKRRRSYVLWQEKKRPLVVLEFASGDGSEERDNTPDEGKFWIYENRICPDYYGIYEVVPGRIEMHHHQNGRFKRMLPNDAGRYPIRELGLELGIWPGDFMGMDLPWMRWWDEQGNMLLAGHELAAEYQKQLLRERQRAEQERQRAEQERQRLEAKLRELGIDPKTI